MPIPRWVTHALAPSIGLVIVNIMWLSPMSAMLQARRALELGNLNPIPFLVTTFNCIGWIIYSMQKRDFFLFFGNLMGLSLGCFYSLSSLRILGRKDDEKSVEAVAMCESLFVGIVFFWAIMGMIAGIAYGPRDESRTQATIFIGILCDFASISYYAAPLSTVVEILKQRDASSLYAPSIMMNFLNGFSWTVYGFAALGDVLVWLPNLIGTTFAVFQLSLIFAFTRGSFLEIAMGKGKPKPVDTSSSNKNSSSEESRNIKFAGMMLDEAVENPML
jgi:solute carrier family 50 (sugar transporter)